MADGIPRGQFLYTSFPSLLILYIPVGQTSLMNQLNILYSHSQPCPAVLSPFFCRRTRAKPWMCAGCNGILVQTAPKPDRSGAHGSNESAASKEGETINKGTLTENVRRVSSYLHSSTLLIHALIFSTVPLIPYQIHYRLQGRWIIQDDCKCVYSAIDKYTVRI